MFGGFFLFSKIEFFCIFAASTIIIMCTITLEYNPCDALARRKLALLLATGLFIQKDFQIDEPTADELQEHREMREAMLAHSRNSMSHVIARYL